MKRKINNRGQTALILILLAAAALIFLSITLNWGRISEVKNMLSVSADEAASQLASDAASYGEQEKQTYLKDINKRTESTGIILDIIAVIVAIGILIYTGGAGAGAAAGSMALAAASLGMAVANLVLQAFVIQPMITQLWNEQQKNQPVEQQFYEQGVAAALQGAVSDQVALMDYFDENANGLYGYDNKGHPEDQTIGRFAFFYGERLKMLNQGITPQITFFYDQLGEFMNGETCLDNWRDYNSTTPAGGVAPLDPNCIDPAAAKNASPSDKDYCHTQPLGPMCQGPIPNGFQLNDSCTDSDTQDPNTYNPYCDPCCQLLSIDGKNVRPLSPACDSGTSAYGAPVQCWTNNPYNTSQGSNDSTRTLLYDPTYQEYANGTSFLDQFGRDQQYIPLAKDLPLTDLTLQGNFPNGIYPFFWLMMDSKTGDSGYSPEVDNIDSTKLKASQVHWCVASTPTNGIVTPENYSPPSSATLAAFPDLAQLSLPYICRGSDCCINYLPDNLTNNVPSSDGTKTGTINGVIDMVGSPSLPGAVNPVLDPRFGENGAGSWQPGDNQMCIDTYHCADGSTCSPAKIGTCQDGSSCTSWPYNGSSSTGLPDGTCEWTNSSNPPPPIENSTADSLDDTMHTLSDFTVFAKTILNENPGLLNSTFSSWYPQAAEWIAPVCGQVNQQGFFLTNNNNQAQAACNNTVACPVGGTCLDSGVCSNDNTTYCGAPTGRLLSIYDPAGSGPDGYPGIQALQLQNNTTTVDVLKDWENAITEWLNNIYAPTGSTSSVVSGYTGPTVWCVPSDSTEDELVKSGLEVSELNGTRTIVPTREYNYIKSSSGTNNWGDLPHVISCLNYNAQVPAVVGGANNGYTSYQNCLAALATCSVQYDLNAPTACQNLGPSPDPAAGPAPVYDGCLANGNYVKWVKSIVSYGNFGAIYNYQACQTLLMGQMGQNCSSDSFVNDNACDPAVLGRSLLTGPAPAPGCNANYLQWVQNSLDLFEDEAPKFARRSAFLTDIYTRAQTMQKIFYSGDAALHNFLKGCNQCVQEVQCPKTGLCPGTTPPTACGPPSCDDDSTCGDVHPGLCSDGTACLPAGKCSVVSQCSSSGDIGGTCQDYSGNADQIPCGADQCADGGPAAQLMWAKSQAATTTSLPNAVIYGWQDNPPIGGSGGCVDVNGTRIGCGHVVKVTAFSAGRPGQPAQSFIQPNKPQIVTTTKKFIGLPVSRSYTLMQRDGYVYVSIQRWDQDHSNPVNFPNGHSLWQMVFHKPSASAQGVGSIFDDCTAPYPTINGATITTGIGLIQNTAAGLQAAMTQPWAKYDKLTIPILGKAFMLNGYVDKTNGPGTFYKKCLGDVDGVNGVLQYGVESHACAEYVASGPPNAPPNSNCANKPGTNSVQSGVSQNGDCDYAVKFVDCNSIDGGNSPQSSLPGTQ